jgi:hypothetical protein
MEALSGNLLGSKEGIEKLPTAEGFRNEFFIWRAV